jgi:hypothetical protein
MGTENKMNGTEGGMKITRKHTFQMGKCKVRKCAQMVIAWNTYLKILFFRILVLCALKGRYHCFGETYYLHPVVL